MNDFYTFIISACINAPKLHKPWTTYNLCTETLTSVKDIIGYAEKAFGKFEYEFVQADKYWNGYDNIFDGEKPLLDEVVIREVNKYSLGSIEKAYLQLGWQPTHRSGYRYAFLMQNAATSPKAGVECEKRGEEQTLVHIPAL